MNEGTHVGPTLLIVGPEADQSLRSPLEDVVCHDESAMFVGCLLPGHRRSSVPAQNRIHRCETISQNVG